MFSRGMLYFLAICQIVFFTSSLQASEVSYIHAGYLIDPAAGKASKNRLIEVSGQKIVSIKAMPNTVPENVNFIDLSDKWVLPGLIDTHSHMALSGAPEGHSDISSATAAITAIKNAQEVLAAGFTTIRDLGAEPDYVMSDVRRATEKGWFILPTIQNAGKMLAPYGGDRGRPDVAPFELGHTWGRSYIDVDSVDDGVKAVRQNIHYGAKVIKVYADIKPYFMNEEHLSAIVNEAHRAGFKVGAHVAGGEAAKAVILAGVDSVEHGFDLTPELLKLMKQKGTVLGTTDFPYEHLKVIFRGNEALAKEWHAKIVNRLKMARKAEVTLVYGTDVVYEIAGRTRGEMMLDFISTWKDAEIADREILQAMTTNAAVAMGIQKERGAIAAELFADIIATYSNPLEDIEALRSVSFIMKNGAIIKAAE